MQVGGFEWLVRLAFDFDLQPVTWSISAFAALWLGIARGQWLAALVFGFSCIYAAGWLVFWLWSLPRFLNDPFLQQGWRSMTLPPLMFFWSCVGISGHALWRAAPMKAPLPVIAALIVAHLFNLFAIALAVS